MGGRGGGRINGGGCHFQVLFSTAFQQHIIETLFLIEAPPQAPPSLVPRPHPASILLAPVTYLFPLYLASLIPRLPCSGTGRCIHRESLVSFSYDCDAINFF